MLRLRMISFGLAGFVCISIVYMALTARFSAITDLFTDQEAIKTVIEEEKKPPPPPPPPPNTPPPPPPPMMEIIAPDPTAEAVVTDIPVTVVPPPPITPPAPPVITNPQWIERPNGNDFARYYPERALTRERTGSVVLECVVNANGRLSCSVASEEPSGWGFGEASIRASRHFRMRPQLENGQPSEGGRVRVPMRWQL